jgi:hypothetical protein
MKPKGKLVIAWLFGVTLALIPLLFDPVHRTTERHPPQLLSLIIHGEVLIIAVALLVDTFVRAAASDDARLRRFVLTGACGITLLLLGYDTADVRTTVETTTNVLTDDFAVRVVWLHSSIGFFISLV